MPESPQPPKPLPAYAGAEQGLRAAPPGGAHRPLFRRMGRGVLRMLRPLALPVLHRMDWRVRGAVDRSGTASAVLRLEEAMQAVSRMVGLLSVEGAQRHQALQDQNQDLQSQNQALQSQGHEMMARLGAVEREMLGRMELIEREMLARLELVAREQKQLGAQVGALRSDRSTPDLLEDLRSDLTIRLDAFSLSLLRAKVFSVELATLEARLKGSIEGMSEGNIGPNLTHFASRETFAGSMFKNNPEDLRTWLRDPQGVKPGNAMKIPGAPLSSDEIGKLIAYLETLN